MLMKTSRFIRVKKGTRVDQNIISCDGRWRDCRNCVAFEMQIPVCWRSLSWKAGRKDMDMCLLRHFRKCRRFLQSFGWKIIYVCLRTGLRYWNGELMRPDYTHHLKFKQGHYFLVIAFVLHRKRLFLTWIYLPIENISEYRMQPGFELLNHFYKRNLTSLLDHVNNML